jgi:hypothetical protein
MDVTAACHQCWPARNLNETVVRVPTIYVQQTFACEQEESDGPLSNAHLSVGVLGESKSIPVGCASVKSDSAG